MIVYKPWPRDVTTVPHFLGNVTHIVGFTYTKTVARSVQVKNAIRDHDLKVGIINVSCNCSTSPMSILQLDML